MEKSSFLGGSQLIVGLGVLGCGIDQSAGILLWRK